MPTATLTFTLPIQTSVQTGDLILYCNPATVGTFSTAAQSDVVLFGTCLAVASNRLTMTVNHDAGIVPPTASSFILFSKDSIANTTTALGYYVEVKLKNNSTTEAELFSIGCDMFESSK